MITTTVATSHQTASHYQHSLCPNSHKTTFPKISHATAATSHQHRTPQHMMQHLTNLHPPDHLFPNHITQHSPCQLNILSLFRPPPSHSKSVTPHITLIFFPIADYFHTRPTARSHAHTPDAPDHLNLPDCVVAVGRNSEGRERE